MSFPRQVAWALLLCWVSAGIASAPAVMPRCDVVILVDDHGAVFSPAGTLSPGESWNWPDPGRGRVDVLSEILKDVPPISDVIEVPLSLWTNVDFPDGLPVGVAQGLSWGDYDADGYVDLFACHSGNLWRNVGGTTWELAANLDEVIPPTERRYGASFGDYNRDGLPDIATEPRYPMWGDENMHLLKNLGGDAEFVDVAGDPAIVDVQPFNNSETICWGDVDGDGNLDAFVPVYPDGLLGPGNFFLYNLGPSGPGGEYRFAEMSETVGLDNPPGASRPEGAQFADVDFDGDIDLFSNGTLYRNVSTPGVPLFEVMPEAVCGIGLAASRDEGAIFFDYDMDGDQDLFVAYVDDGVRIWENYGDGTFFPAEQEIVDDPFSGHNLGMSAEDWDNDGDIDLSTRMVFRRNLRVESSVRRFTVASHSIPSHHLNSAMPSWGDWDKDGDLDCALANWGEEGHFYENTLYTAATPEADRRHLRVRIVADSPTIARGLEIEYGATAEIHVPPGVDSLRRRKFVASAHGYLNQNDYTLHFAVPPPPPEASGVGLSVDFPNPPADGLWRVDEHVNPVLGEIDPWELADREVEVRRCGSVVLDGVVHDPFPLASPRLSTTGGGPALASPTSALPAPVPAADSSWFTGLAFDTWNATDKVRVAEIVLDGQLDNPVYCAGETFNVAVWDVTDPASPFRVTGGSLTAKTSPRNRRSYIRTDLVLEPGRSYRLVARVSELRRMGLDAPPTEAPLTVLGSLDYSDNDPCAGPGVAAEEEDRGRTALALRYGAAPPSTNADPVGDTLRLGKQGTVHPALQWLDPPASGFEVLRCDSSAGPCPPAPLAMTGVSHYTDTNAAGTVFWYRVRAVNECTSDLYGLGD